MLMIKVYLEYKAETKIWLYVHISFCPYCKVLYDKKLAEEYIECLLKEIELVGSMNEGTKKFATSLYFGGGSPGSTKSYDGTPARFC